MKFFDQHLGAPAADAVQTDLALATKSNLKFLLPEGVRET